MNFLKNKIKKLPVWWQNTLDKYEGKDELNPASSRIVVQPELDEKVLAELNNKQAILEYLSNSGKRVDSIDYIFWEDEEIFKKIVSSVNDAIEFAPRKILSGDKYFLWLLESGKFSSYMIACFCPRIKNDKELAIKAINTDYYSIEYFGDEVRKNKEVLDYLKSKYNYHYEESELTKENIQSYLMNCENDPLHFKKAHYSTRSNILIANHEVSRNPSNYMYLPDNLKLMNMFIKPVLDCPNNVHLLEHIHEDIIGKKSSVAMLSLHNQEVAKKLIDNITDHMQEVKEKNK